MWCLETTVCNSTWPLPWSLPVTSGKYLQKAHRSRVTVASVCPDLPFWFILLHVLEVSKTEVVLVPTYLTVLPGVFHDFI